MLRLVNYLMEPAKSELFKLRAIFKWITENIKFSWNASGKKMTTQEVIDKGYGTATHFCQLTVDMCTEAGLRAKVLRGFGKGHNYRPGHKFNPQEDNFHYWVAVFIMESWRFLDPTWAAGKLEHDGTFTQGLEEHYFLTDPEVMIWSHYPWNETDSSYNRWQLLDHPITLDEFNEMPKVTPYFFQLSLQIRSRPQNPIVFRVQTEVKIGSHEAIRYKYKLYPSHELENDSLNQYVFCQLKEDRRVGAFTVTPPIEGRYYLKVRQGPEHRVACLLDT